MSYNSILTVAGKAAFINAASTGGKVNFSRFEVGDGNPDNDPAGYVAYDPVGSETALRNARHGGPINDITIDPDDPSRLVVETIIPASVGGFWISEFGLFDDQDNLLLIAKLPETQKTHPDSGAASDLRLRTYVQTLSEDHAKLVIDPAIVLASRQYVDDQIKSLDLTVDVSKVEGLAAALAGKSDMGHGHEMISIQGLLTTLATFAKNVHSHTINNITGLTERLAEKANVLHSHGWTQITGKPSTFPAAAHSHTYNSLSGKPTAFPPSSHSHSYKDLMGLPQQTVVTRTRESTGLWTITGLKAFNPVFIGARGLEGAGWRIRVVSGSELGLEANTGTSYLLSAASTAYPQNSTVPSFVVMPVTDTIALDLNSLGAVRGRLTAYQIQEVFS